MPHLCLDPVVIASEIVLALQNLISRNIDPFESAVISICSLKASDAPNVIPATVQMRGTIRAHNPTIREYLHERIAHMAQCVSEAHGATVRVEIVRGYPVLVNAQEQTRALKRAFGEISEAKTFDRMAENTTEMRPMMASDDFSYYLESVPGTMAFLGVGSGIGDAPDLHSPKFLIDEGALPIGSAILAAIALTRACKNI